MSRNPQHYEPVYVDDLENDEALKLVSAEAWKFWVRIFLFTGCKSPRRGYLLKKNGQVPTEDEIAVLFGMQVASVRMLLHELETHQVFDREDDVIVCRRQARDAERCERRSKTNSDNARKRWDSQSGAMRTACESHANSDANRNASRNANTGVGDGSGSLVQKSSPERARAPEVEGVVAYYKALHPKVKNFDRERKLILARLQGGYTTEDLCHAIDGCHLSPHHCGQNPSGTKYQSLELIMRDSKHVSMFIEIWEQGTGPAIPVNMSAAERNQSGLRAIAERVAARQRELGFSEDGSPVDEPAPEEADTEGVKRLRERVSEYAATKGAGSA